jgi:hypothetical protein
MSITCIINQRQICSRDRITETESQRENNAHVYSVHFLSTGCPSPASSINAKFAAETQSQREKRTHANTPHVSSCVEIKCFSLWPVPQQKHKKWLCSRTSCHGWEDILNLYIKCIYMEYSLIISPFFSETKNHHKRRNHPIPNKQWKKNPADLVIIYQQ